MKEIQLSQNKIALVDDEDFERLAQYKWCARLCVDRFYAVTAKNVDGKTKGTYMHRFIMNALKGQNVDHKNGNSLDNQKHNLRLCTQRQNCHNRQANKNCEFKGISKNGKKFRASIWLNGKRFHIGTYATEIEAAKSYDKKATEAYGEFAHLNFSK